MIDIAYDRLRRAIEARYRLRPAALMAWALAASFSAPILFAAEIRQTVLQKGIYAVSDDTEGICASAREGCPEVARQFANDSFWGRYFAAVCLDKNKDKCVCSADVVYPVLIGGGNSPAVNKAFRKIAEEYACTKGMAITKLRYEVTFDVGQVFSVVFDGYARATGGQGSCHSHVAPITANSRTGQVYKLDDVLTREEEAAITDNMVDYFATYFASRKSSDEAGRLKNELRRILGEKLWNLGFYLRDRQLFVDLDEYILSCSEGPSFAIPIPSRYITNIDILGVLRFH